MRAFVVHIFISPNAGHPMQSMASVRAIAGVGLEGDRYALKRGKWQYTRREIEKQVTLIESESIQIVNATGVERYTPEETRRNIVTCGIRLNDLVGRIFVVGGVSMRGVELADPCQRPAMLAHKKFFPKLFAGMGGLRCAILSNGLIKCSDTIIVQ